MSATAPTPAETHQAIRDGLADLLLRIDPGTAGAIAINLIRLAAAIVALGQAHDTGGPRAAATELLTMLADGPPQLPADSQAAAA